jgi:transposase
MAKEREKKIAKVFYVEQAKEAKEISKLLNVSEPTLSKWVNENNAAWKRERNARMSNPSVRTDNIKQIINDLSEQRITLGGQLKQAEFNNDLEEITRLRESIARIDDAVSKWNKTLTSIDKESQVTLSVYLAVMEMLFDALKAFDEKLFFQTLDFQEVHLNDVSLKFK